MLSKHYSKTVKNIHSVKLVYTATSKNKLYGSPQEKNVYITASTNTEIYKGFLNSYFF